MAMILTPEEAAQTWCPHARNLMSFGSNVNRQTGPDYFTANWEIQSAAAMNDGATCQAAKCSQWRWVDVREEEGYCGLAGRPLYTTSRIKAEIDDEAK